MSKSAESALPLAVRAYHLSYLSLRDRARATRVSRAWCSAVWHAPMTTTCVDIDVRLLSHPPRAMLQRIVETAVTLDLQLHRRVHQWTDEAQRTLTTLLQETKHLRDLTIRGEGSQCDPVVPFRDLAPLRPLRRYNINVENGDIATETEWFELQSASMEEMRVEGTLGFTLQAWRMGTPWTCLQRLHLVDNSSEWNPYTLDFNVLATDGRDVFPALEMLSVEMRHKHLYVRALDAFREWWPWHPTLTRFELCDTTMRAKMTRATPRAPFQLCWQAFHRQAQIENVAPTPVPILILSAAAQCDWYDRRRMLHVGELLDVGTFWPRLLSNWTLATESQCRLRLEVLHVSWGSEERFTDLLRVVRTVQGVRRADVCFSAPVWSALLVERLQDVVAVARARGDHWTDFHLAVTVRCPPAAPASSHEMHRRQDAQRLQQELDSISSPSSSYRLSFV